VPGRQQYCRIWRGNHAVEIRRAIIYLIPKAIGAKAADFWHETNFEKNPSKKYFEYTLNYLLLTLGTLIAPIGIGVASRNSDIFLLDNFSVSTFDRPQKSQFHLTIDGR
jgi:hypothetical protein